MLHKVSPTPGRHAVDLAKHGLTIYYQSPDQLMVDKVRKAADAGGLLGKSVFVEQSGLDRICLADNLADEIVNLVGVWVHNNSEEGNAIFQPPLCVGKKPI